MLHVRTRIWTTISFKALRPILESKILLVTSSVWNPKIINSKVDTKVLRSRVKLADFSLIKVKVYIIYLIFWNIGSTLFDTIKLMQYMSRAKDGFFNVTLVKHYVFQLFKPLQQWNCLISITFVVHSTSKNFSMDFIDYTVWSEFQNAVKSFQFFKNIFITI